MRAWGILGASALLVASCSGSDGDTPQGDFRVLVQYDSTMSVATFAVAAVTADGVDVWARSEHDAPLFLDPPGIRQAELRFERPAEGSLTVLVDGLSGEGAVVGSGRLEVVVDAELESVQVRLGAPVVCGDGQRLGREQCDDGDAEPGDGCSALCMVEPGWSCEGIPSRCGRCGDGTQSAGEQCDDGNNDDGDGCSSTCESEVAAQPYLRKVESLSPQSAEGPDWLAVDGTQLLLPTLENGQRWVVFASGVLGSSSIEEVSAQAALRVDGEVRDDFGHQSLGDSDNGAGFVTFHVVEDPGPVMVDMAIASSSGITTISQVRLVAMRLLPQEQALSVPPGDAVEVTGIDLPLASLGFEVRQPGRYLVLAKANLSEGPGGDTARIWLTTPEGRVPFDDKGVTFSSPRDARVPFFAARTLELSEGDVSFELRGTSSGSGSIEAWWDPDYAFRRQVTVTAGEVAVPSGYPVQISFNHQAWVGADRAMPDGRDVRVVYNVGGDVGELTRVIDPDRGWNSQDTSIWVRVPESIPAGETLAGLWVYFGAERPEEPLEDPADVFDFFDSFDGSELSPQWQGSQGTVSVANGLLTLGPGAVLAGPSLAEQALTESVILEGRLRFVSDPLEGMCVYLGIGWARDGQGGAAGFIVRDGAHFWSAGGMTQSFMPNAPTAFHTYGIGIPDLMTAVFFQDGQEIGQGNLLATGVNVGSEISLVNGSQTDFKYAWVRARPYIAVPPTVLVEPVTGPAGLRPSRFDGLRLLAIPLEPFAEVVSADSPERVRTTETATVVLASAVVPESAVPKEHLVIMATRVSGDSSEGRRRVGMCLQDEQAMLQTSHKINRDNSDATGYHHIAGVVDARTTAEPVQYSTAIRSPDGLGVEGAASTISIIRF